MGLSTTNMVNRGTEPWQQLPIPDYTQPPAVYFTSFGDPVSVMSNATQAEINSTVTLANPNLKQAALASFLDPIRVSLSRYFEPAPLPGSQTIWQRNPLLFWGAIAGAGLLLYALIKKG